MLAPLASGPEEVRSLTHGLPVNSGIPTAKKRQPLPLLPGHEHSGEQQIQAETGLSPGSSLPAVTVLQTDGTSLVLPEALDAAIRQNEDGRHQVLLVAWNPACGFCRRIASDLAQLNAGPASVLVLSSEVDEEITTAGIPQLLDNSGQAMAALGVRGTPSALVVSNGHVAVPLARGGPAVLALAASLPSIASFRANSVLPVGG